MASDDRDARAFLDEFVASRGPDPQRRRSNWNATLSRLDEEPLVDTTAPTRASGLRTWIVAAAAVVLIAAAAWRGRALVEPTTVPRAEASANEVAAPETHVAPVRTTLPIAVPSLETSAPTPSDVPSEAVQPEVVGPLDDSSSRPSGPDLARRRAPDRLREPAVAEPIDATPAAVVVTPERLALETGLIARARAAAAKHDDAEAIALLRRHAREFPDGAMAEDRRAWLAIVQCRSAVSAGRPAADAFLAAHPRSPYAERVRAACDDESRKIE
jgi:hypothetical protein